MRWTRLIPGRIIVCFAFGAALPLMAGMFMCGNSETGESIWRETKGIHTGYCFLFDRHGKMRYHVPCGTCGAWYNLGVGNGGWNSAGDPIRVD